ncbi:MAG: transposon-encoded TnpW family protein [Eubacteriales bacterium]
MNEKQEVNQVWNEKELAPHTQEQTHAPTDLPPEGETQTTEGKTSKKLPENPSIAPPCRHEIEGNPVPTHHEQATQSEPVSEKTDLSSHQTHEDGRPTESQTTENKPPSFTHKIGKTTYHVNMHFSETATESLLDKIKRMLINDFNNI